jgi:hypothetical protein
MSQKVARTQFFYARITLLAPRATWFLLLLFIARSHPSIGQPLPYSYTKMDTIRAVQRLFDQKRMGGRIATAVGIPVALVGGVVGLFGSTFSALITLGQTKNSILSTTLLGSSVGLAPTGIGIGRLIRYSRRREDILLDAYESGDPLPAFIRRKLRPGYF